MRVTTGFTRRRRHKKILKATKGYRLTNSKNYTRAHEAYMHAGMYSLKSRRRRIGQFRKLWITRLTAFLREQGHKYSEFIFALKQKNIALNRKILSQLAVLQPQVLSKVVEKAFAK